MSPQMIIMIIMLILDTQSISDSPRLDPRNDRVCVEYATMYDQIPGYAQFTCVYSVIKRTVL